MVQALSHFHVHSSPYSWRERADLLLRLRQAPKVYDLCIVGGGITGAAIARDAVLRGLSVLLVEKNDFASGTSSRSSKLVHGGVRYLEQFEFRLVQESTRERARLWRNAPHLVAPLPFLFPAFKSSRVPLWKLNIGLWLYDFLAMFRSPTLHKRFGRKRTRREEPLLKSDELTGSIFYWDAITNDAMITFANAVDAVTEGADVISRMQLESVEWNPQTHSAKEQGHLIHLKDTLPGGESYSARARVVVSAAGPWTDELMQKAGVPKPRMLAPTRGSHIVVPAERLKIKHAIVIMHPRDGRVLFAIPWDECTVLGTTDIFDKSSPDHVFIHSDEIDYLLEAGNSYFPSTKLTRADVMSTWAGLRPLLAPPENESASAVSREHVIQYADPGLLIVAGGKLTTHRDMAEQALDKLFKGTKHWEAPLGQGSHSSTTRERPLPRMAFPAKPSHTRVSLEDLAGICRTQMVLSLEDLFVRRTSIYYKDPAHGWLLLPELKETLCRELNWNEARWHNEVEAYRKYLDDAVLKPLRRGLPSPIQGRAVL